MDNNTAGVLTGAITDVADLKLRLTALENVLQFREPELFAAYRQEISNLKNATAHQMFEISLQGLQKRLESQ